jgi:hypothetical protein
MIEPKQNINKYGVTLRLVELVDADFILNLRTNGNLNKHLSSTSSDIQDQISWIENYKKRELLRYEYYFIAIDDDGNRFGTIRLYNFTKSTFEVGSWLFLPDSPVGMAIKTEIIAKEIGFEELGYETCIFSVRKKNYTVLNYHRRFKPVLIKESDMDLFFKLNKREFLTTKEKILNLL